MALHLVYGKLNTKFEKTLVSQTKWEVDLKPNKVNVGVQTYFYTRSFMYYACNMHNLIIHKYFLKFH